MKITISSVDWKFYDQNKGERHFWVNGSADLDGPGPVLSVQWEASYNGSANVWELGTRGATLAPDTIHAILGEMKKILSAMVMLNPGS